MYVKPPFFKPLSTILLPCLKMQGGGTALLPPLPTPMASIYYICTICENLERATAPCPPLPTPMYKAPRKSEKKIWKSTHFWKILPF